MTEPVKQSVAGRVEEEQLRFRFVIVDRYLRELRLSRLVSMTPRDRNCLEDGMSSPRLL